MTRCRPVALASLFVALAPLPVSGWEWTGNAWADYSAFLSPIDAPTKAKLQAILAVGDSLGRIEGRMGQIGDSITESSAYFRNATLEGPSSDETGHDYTPARSWLSYSGLQAPDANSFYRDHGKGPTYGNLGGWCISDAVAAGHPDQGVLTGDGAISGDYSWGLLMFGTNDIDNGAWDVTAWKEEFRTFIQGYVDLGVIPVISTIPPELAHVGSGKVEAANVAIVALAEEEQIPWVDFYGLVLHHQPVNWVGTLIGGDGTHPTASTGGRGFSESAQTSTDGYALRTKLSWDMAEKLRHIIWNDGAPDAATGSPAPTELRPSELQVMPNPFVQSTLIWNPSGDSLTIVDVTGRHIRSLRSRADDLFRWDGTDDRGRAVPPGVYFVRSDQGPRPASVRIVRLR